MLGALDPEPEQEVVEPVVAGARVRRLDRPQLGEPLLGVAPELLDVRDQRLGRRQATDEEPQVEASAAPGSGVSSQGSSASRPSA